MGGFARSWRVIWRLAYASRITKCSDVSFYSADRVRTPVAPTQPRSSGRASVATSTLLSSQTIILPMCRLLSRRYNQGPIHRQGVQLLERFIQDVTERGSKAPDSR